MQKPEKIYLENTNLAYTLATNNTEIGNIRETFFLNQLSYNHKVEFPNTGDFLVDQKILFEIGGKSKTGKQVKETNNTYCHVNSILAHRHCEARSYPGLVACFWIASQARNDVIISLT